MKNILIVAGDSDGGSWAWHLDDISELDSYPDIKIIIQKEITNPSSFGINEDYEWPIADILNDVTGYSKALKNSIPFLTEHIVYYYCRR